MFGKSKPLASIDLAEPRRRLEEVAAERTRVEAARATAERERNAIGTELTHRRNRRAADGERVADALLAGDVLDDVEPTEALLQKQDALQAGIGELNARLRNLDLRRNEIRQGVANELAAGAAPLVAGLDERARKAVRELLNILADANAVREATGSGAAANLSYNLADPLQQIAARLEMRDRRDLVPSREIIAHLAPAADAIKLARRQMPG